MNRLYNLDYLRGLSAFGIMVYHYMGWAGGSFTSESFLGRLGVYGVSIFYVLSGLTLYYVYHKRMEPSKKQLITFAKKRFYRIFPLLWLATLITIILSRQFPNISDLTLNLTGLFGLFHWDGYFATGAWSIGNELVFYIFFPVFILLKNKSRIAFILLSILITITYLYFAYIIFDINQPLSEQWRNYVNPLNQLLLFLGGFLIGMNFKDVNIGMVTNLLLLICGLSIFIFYPSAGDLILLVTGNNRIIFTISCFMICLSFYKLNYKLPEIFDKPLTMLGEASYSVYLLHPIVYSIISIGFSILEKYLYHFPIYILVISSILITLGISYIVYEKFEKFFMEMSKSEKTTVPPTSFSRF